MTGPAISSQVPARLRLSRDHWRDLPVGDVLQLAFHDRVKLAIGSRSELRLEETRRDAAKFSHCGLLNQSQAYLLTRIPRGERPAAMRRVMCASAALDWAYENSQTALCCGSASL
jgi:hypothetical protein